jgi:hypothetical protein
MQEREHKTFSCLCRDRQQKFMVPSLCTRLACIAVALFFKFYLRISFAVLSPLFFHIHFLKYPQINLKNKATAMQASTRHAEY